MQASYISYFGGGHGLDKSGSVCQIDVETGASNTAINEKKAAHPKIRRKKSQVPVEERSELFSQYRLDL